MDDGRLDLYCQKDKGLRKLEFLLADAFTKSVRFLHIPGLDERYRFSVSNADPAQVHLPNGFLRLLVTGPDLHLQFGRDMFIVSYAGLAGQTPSEEQVRDLFNLATRLANELREIRG